MPTGKKGLGKLALFGIGDIVNIITCQGKEAVDFTMDWDEINNWEYGKPYTPKFEIIPEGVHKKGTIITLTNLKRKTGFPILDYSESIARLFNFNDDFIVYLSLNDEDPIKIDNKLKYQNIIPEFKWDIKDVIKINEKIYTEKDSIIGSIVTTEKPLKANLRGITLFANGRMVNAPEFFGPSESSHFYSYSTGWLNIDFIDNWEVDVISTNRQSIDWENPLTTDLREYLASCLLIIEKQWREKRKLKKQQKFSEKTHINIEEWLSKLPKDVSENIEKFLNILDDAPELSEESQQGSIEIMHIIAPEYATYHWRHLHENIKKISFKDYEKGDYLRAAEEAIKLYEMMVMEKSEISDFGQSLMGKSFGKNNEPLKVTDNITITDQNIEEGQKHMSMGIMAGFRNPAMHSPKNIIYPEIFDDYDCLDLLSIISYLFKKFEKARNINK